MPSLLTQKIQLKSVDVVRKISFRFLSVPTSDGFTKNFYSESDERYFDEIIELNNFSNDVYTF